MKFDERFVSEALAERGAYERSATHSAQKGYRLLLEAELAKICPQKGDILVVKTRRPNDVAEALEHYFQSHDCVFRLAIFLRPDEQLVTLSEKRLQELGLNRTERVQTIIRTQANTTAHVGGCQRAIDAFAANLIAALRNQDHAEVD